MPDLQVADCPAVGMGKLAAADLLVGSAARLVRPTVASVWLLYGHAHLLSGWCRLGMVSFISHVGATHRFCSILLSCVTNFVSAGFEF